MKENVNVNVNVNTRERTGTGFDNNNNNNNNNNNSLCCTNNDKGRSHLGTVTMTNESSTTDNKVLYVIKVYNTITKNQAASQYRNAFIWRNTK